MKNLHTQLAKFLCLAIFYSSCSVDTSPEANISNQNYWNTVSDLRLAANYFYSTLPGLTNSDVTEDNWSTDAYPNSTGNNISDGSRVAPATSNDYDYYRIYQANQLIEKSAQVLQNGGKAEEVNWYIGEARFFRAWYYFELLKRFGGTPLITKTMLVDDPDIFLPRASREEVLTLIYADLDFAISVLRTSDQLNSSKEYGRISKTAALSFKSRVALFEGTRSKFHQYGDYKKHLNLAKDAAEAVINTGDHAIFSQPTAGTAKEVLNNAYFNLFQEAGEGRANKENIIVRIYGQTRENNIITTPVQRFYEGNNIVATQNFVDSYLMADGLPKKKSPLYTEPNAKTTHAGYFSKQDSRMSFTLFKKGDEYITSGTYNLPHPNLQRSGFTIRKYANKTYWGLQASFIDKPVLRYAEVLLNYAETIYELEGTISDELLNKTINQLRARLPQINIGTTTEPNFQSIPKLTNAFIQTHGLSMREEIRRERRIELAFEGFRYWDLIRWKTAEIELPETLYGSYLFSEYLTNSGQAWSPSTPVDSRNYIILQDAKLRKFEPERDYLWPIPMNEIAKNPNNLTQNPQW